jgi:hypothetical protein
MERDIVTRIEKMIIRRKITLKKLNKRYEVFGTFCHYVFDYILTWRYNAHIKKLHIEYI